MADYRPSGIARNRLVALLLALSVAVVALAGFAAVKLDVFTEPTAAEPELPIAVSSRLLDFGAVPLNGAVIRHLVVRNDGTDPLHASLAVDGEKYSVSPERLILHPGISSRIQIAVKADELGDLRDRLRIEIEGLADSNPLVISLRGEATLGETDGVTPATGVPVAARPQLRADAAASDDAPHDELPALPAPSGVAGQPSDTLAPVLIADGSTATRATGEPGAGRAGGAATATPSTTARRRTGDSAARSRDTAANSDTDSDRRRRVGPYIPGVSVPIRSVSEVPDLIGSEITDSDRTGARALPERTMNDGKLPEQLPEDEQPDDFERDIFDDESDEPEPDPFTRPMLTISGASTIQLMGSRATFYPQEIGLVGADVGGPFSLTSEVRMPMVYLAFGESMLFRQTGPISGEWDPTSGQVNVQMPLEAVDTDGDAAPWQVTLTTGTVYARNPSGVLLSKTGTPRSPVTGIVRLVALFEIPVGFANGAEKHLAVFEILGELSFGSTPRSGFDHRF